MIKSKFHKKLTAEGRVAVKRLRQEIRKAARERAAKRKERDEERAIARAARIAVGRGRPKGSKNTQQRCPVGQRRFGPRGQQVCVPSDELAEHVAQLLAGEWDDGRQRCKRGMRKAYAGEGQFVCV